MRQAIFIGLLIAIVLGLAILTACQGTEGDGFTNNGRRPANACEWTDPKTGTQYWGERYCFAQRGR